MKIVILDSAKKKKFLSGVDEFGIKKIRELLVKSGKEKIRAYSGDLSNEEIMEIYRMAPIEAIGLYVGKDSVDRHGVREVRLGLEGLYAWKNQVVNKIIELSEEKEEEWFRGKNIELSEGSVKGYVILRSKMSGDFIGVGKVGGEAGMTLFNFLPKERRRKSNVI